MPATSDFKCASDTFTLIEEFGSAGNRWLPTEDKMLVKNASADHLTNLLRGEQVAIVSVEKGSTNIGAELASNQNVFRWLMHMHVSGKDT